MLILQDIWTRWTKASRGADRNRLTRPRLDEAYPIPSVTTSGDFLCHEVFAKENEGFAVEEQAYTFNREDWDPRRAVPLSWVVRDGIARITLRSPSEYRLQTKWPAFLPSPLFTLAEGETARIDWNGRLRMSTFGSNRSSYFEQHIYWLAMADSAEPRLFLDAKPKKHIDLRTEIY